MIFKIAEHCGCLDEERAEVGPRNGFTRLFEKAHAALDLRVAKLEVKAVHLDSRLASYLRQRIARDNILQRSADSMTDGIEAFEERLNNVELAAFPDAATTVAKVIGAPEQRDYAASEHLDRRPRPRKP